MHIPKTVKAGAIRIGMILGTKPKIGYSVDGLVFRSHLDKIDNELAYAGIFTVRKLFTIE